MNSEDNENKKMELWNTSELIAKKVEMLKYPMQNQYNFTSDQVNEFIVESAKTIRSLEKLQDDIVIYMTDNEVRD